MNRIYTVSNRKPQLWVEILITILGIAGVITFLAVYESAFPDASMDVTISRPQAKEIAEEQLSRLGHTLEGYQFALSFLSDWQAAVYLQRTLGIEEYNTRLAQEKWPLYYWSARWFKPLEKEEFRVYLMPDGRLLGFNHIIKEDLPGINIAQADAQRVAQSFLTQQVNWHTDEWELVEASSQTKQGGRIDHTFTWKSKEFSAGESELRYTTVVQGNQVGYLVYFIKSPESFNRQYASERNTAAFINNIAYYIALFGFMIIGIIAIFLSRPDARRATIPASLVAGVTLASYLNSIPLYKSYYGTTQNYSLFWIDAVISAVSGVVFSGGLTFILLLGAQSLMKFVWPKQDRILARGTDRWINFSRSAWRGLMLGGIQMAYVVLFYLATTTYLGWWSPVTSQYSDIFATPFPFFYAFESGLSAALIEELSIRLIGIGFFLWLFRDKHKWLAVLIPSLIWAFAHSGYVTYPIYARGVELTFVAVFLGFIFLKFDLLTTIMSHFAYNMMLTGLVLLRSSEDYYRLSGWVVVFTLLLPLIPGLYLAVRRYLGNKARTSENFTLSPLDQSEVERLSVLPIKTGWQALTNQSNRITLCLHVDTKIAGFVTGFIDEKKLGYVDGVFIARQWRRQYWGTNLLDAIYEDLKNSGASDVRIVIRSNDIRTKSFLHNLFWRTSVQILIKDNAQPDFKTAIKTLFNALRKEKSDERDWEFPRNLI